MKINETTALATSKVTLVPYSTHHVPTYHEWMQDPELQAATASEPLSLPEEYEMQRSWRLDHDKLTFIVCAPLDHESVSQDHGPVRASVVDAPERMIGDINLFLFEPDYDEQEDDQTAKDQPRSQGIVGEIELMIARKDLHRQGYGRAALVTFLSHIFSSWEDIATEYNDVAAQTPQLEYLRVKINESNTRSIALFTSIGFLSTSEGANYFGEIEMRWQPNQQHLRSTKGWEEVKTLQYIDPSI